MIRQRRGSFGSLPSNTRQTRRLYEVPAWRKSPPRTLRLIAQACMVVLTESVVELLVLTHRVRTNQAPLATGRYRR